MYMEKIINLIRLRFALNEVRSITELKDRLKIKHEYAIDAIKERVEELNKPLTIIDKKGNTVLRDRKYFNRLFEDIEKITGGFFGDLTTKKRILRIVKVSPNYKPDLEKRNNIAKYLECSSWEQLTEEVDELTKFYSSELNELAGNNNWMRSTIVRRMRPSLGVFSEDLEKGDIINFILSRKGELSLEYRGNNKYKVLDSKEISLIKGDIIAADSFARENRIYTKTLIRDHKNMGMYMSNHKTYEFKVVRGPKFENEVSKFLMRL